MGIQQGSTGVIKRGFPETWHWKIPQLRIFQAAVDDRQVTAQNRDESWAIETRRFIIHLIRRLTNEIGWFELYIYIKNVSHHYFSRLSVFYLSRGC